MGLTFLELEVANLARPNVAEKLEFLIDSGATYSVVPAAVLDRLSIEPLAEQDFRLANGTKIRRRRGFAFFWLGNHLGGSDVIFGEAGDSVLLGALTLESLGFVLDPIRRTLEPLPMILAGV